MLLPRSTLLVRLGIIFFLASALTVLPNMTSVASAQDDDDDDDEYGDDDDDDYGDDDDDDDAEKEEQPPVTAGGMYTKKSYPIAELDRPLTLIGGMAEVRGGLDIDVSKDNAFEKWRGKVDGRYGLKDNLELQFGLNALLAGDIQEGGPENQFEIDLGVETAIAFDLVDFRAMVMLPMKPDFTMDLAFGFPFRYKPKPKVAIIALDKLMTIHTQSAVDGVDENGDPVESAKPDLTIGVGLIYQAAPPLALILRGEVTIPRFNTDNVAIPATAAVQFSPSNKVDIGGEFTFGNLKSEDPVKFYDQRSLLLFLQARM